MSSNRPNKQSSKSKLHRKHKFRGNASRKEVDAPHPFRSVMSAEARYGNFGGGNTAPTTRSSIHPPIKLVSQVTSVKTEPENSPLPADFRRFMEHKLPAISAEFYQFMQLPAADAIVISDDEEQPTKLWVIQPKDEKMGRDNDITATETTGLPTTADDTSTPPGIIDYGKLDARCCAIEREQQQQHALIEQMRRDINNFSDLAATAGDALLEQQEAEATVGF